MVLQVVECTDELEQTSGGEGADPCSHRHNVARKSMDPPALRGTWVVRHHL